MPEEYEHWPVSEDEEPETISFPSEHYYTCPTCGQAVDRRDLVEVLHHAFDGHIALTMH